MNPFFTQLQTILKGNLPAKEAHLLMAPEIRIEGLKQESDNFPQARKAAVLIPFYYKENELYTALIKRIEYDGVHSGQMAFAGGRWEEEDIDLIATALREANEEIGINPKKVEIIGCLSQLYIPPSNFRILPVIGFLPEKPTFNLQISEVHSIHEILLKEFFNPKNISTIELKTDYNPSFKAPCYTIENNVIWGATAMVISELCMVMHNSSLIL